MLVWSGKVLEVVEKAPGHNHYICEFGCMVVEPFKREVCPIFFVENGKFVDQENPPEREVGEEVCIPMAWLDAEGVERDAQVDDVPYCQIV